MDFLFWNWFVLNWLFPKTMKYVVLINVPLYHLLGAIINNKNIDPHHSE